MKSSCALYFNNGAEAKKVYGVVIFFVILGYVDDLQGFGGFGQDLYARL